MNRGSDGGLLRVAAFDTFGYQFVGGASALALERHLNVAVEGAAAHRADRPHAAVFLVAAPLEEDQLTGTFVGAGEHIAEHRAAGAVAVRLDDIAGITDAAVGDHRQSAERRRLRALADRTDH